jgi:hypothetical protein
MARFLCEGGEPSCLTNNELHGIRVEYLFRNWQSFIWTKNYALYRTRSLIIMFTGSRRLDPFWPRWIQTLHSNPISLRSLLILSSDPSYGYEVAFFRSISSYRLFVPSFTLHVSFTIFFLAWTHIIMLEEVNTFLNFWLCNILQSFLCTSTPLGPNMWSSPAQCRRERHVPEDLA